MLCHTVTTVCKAEILAHRHMNGIRINWTSCLPRKAARDVGQLNDVATFTCLNLLVFLYKYVNGHRWWRHCVVLMIVKTLSPLSLKGDDDYQFLLNPNPMAVLRKAGRLRGLRVRILSAAYMNVSWERCVVQVEACATVRSLVQGSPTECVCVVQCDYVKQ
jgi:hypothetical protein